MKILLIDADSVIPNLPLMKISTFHKLHGDTVLMFKCNLPYYPNRIKNSFSTIYKFDKVYCSVVFDGNKQFIKGDNIIFGGTGVDLKTILPDDIEMCKPDYTLYPENKTSYGFITRGCIRRCSFCKVYEKEGLIHKVNNIDNIVFHKKVKFLDNNILSYYNHIKILNELIKKNIKCQFNQGLDIRLLTKENSILLSKLNYYDGYFFSFDSWNLKDIIEEKLKLLNWVRDWSLRFYVYIHPDMKLSESVNRVKWLKDHNCLPFIMRDKQCWKSKFNNFYTDLSSYCNQIRIFKKMSFKEFLLKRHFNKERIKNSLIIWNELL